MDFLLENWFDAHIAKCNIIFQEDLLNTVLIVVLMLYAKMHE